ncbi:MAG: hypothetical protein AB7G75_27340 [Candidatus Binatia bacterium]
MDTIPPNITAPVSLPLPELRSRVAVLSGNHTETSALLVNLAFRHCQQQGNVLCIDASRHQLTEVQFRLLLRQRAIYQRLSESPTIPPQMARTALNVVSQGLAQRHTPPPLLLLDSVRETPDWERTVQFLLNAGATIVEVLPTPNALVFGRYNTVILLRATHEQADTVSRAVGRKVSGEDIVALKTGQGFLVHLADVYRVIIPNALVERSG